MKKDLELRKNASRIARTREGSRELLRQSEVTAIAKSGIREIGGVACLGMDVATMINQHRVDQLSFHPSEALAASLAEIQVTALRGISTVQQLHVEQV